ncbi:MAG: hypothetical protein V3U75_05445 [Methylococcaceae bacterium]
MESPFSMWETVLLGAMVLLLIFWFRPGIKASLERSKNTEKDWPAVILPLAIVVLFVVFLISTT